MGLRPLAREACAWSSANIVLFFFFKLSIDELWPNNYVLGAALANWLSHFRIFLNKTFILSLEWLKGLHRVDYMRAYNLIRTHYFGQKFEYCLRACMVTLNSVNFHALTKTIDLLIFIDIYWFRNLHNPEIRVRTKRHVFAFSVTFGRSKLKISWLSPV